MIPYMRIRKKLHLTYAELFTALCYTMLPDTAGKRQQSLRRIKAIWTKSDDRHQSDRQIFVGLSVRTAFDLYLKALNLPPESEVLMSAITIPDMVTILKHHQLVPVPVDIEPETLAPKLSKLECAVSDKSRILLITHLFGTRYPIDPFIKFAQKYHLLLIEDCAQAFAGVDQYTGHVQTDLSMFSFGLIKTSTALGGAVCTVRNRHLYDAMTEMEMSYPVFSKLTIIKKVILALLIKLLTENPVTLGILMAVTKVLGIHYDAFITRITRGFSGGNLLDKIRQRSSPVHLRLLKRKLQKAQGDFLLPAIRCGQYADSLLSDQVERPGIKAAYHTYWLYPVIVSNPGRLILALRQHGFDATRGSTQLTWVELPRDIERKRAAELHPCQARRLMENLVFLPNYESLSEADLNALSKVCLTHGKRLHSDGIHLQLSSETSCIKNMSPLQFREEKINRLKTEAFDLLIVGGGINGAGIAREAVLRGLNVALIEKKDYASGSSGKSANLIHGGFRYIESLQFKTVMECCRARFEQMTLNAHLVDSLPFVLPVYSDTKNSMNKIDLGLWIYDFLDRFKSYGLHKRKTPSATSEMIASLRKDGLTGSLVYCDCKTDDSRLTLANVMDAERQGAVVLNYMTFLEPEFNAEDQVCGASVCDTLSGQCFTMGAHHIIYTMGTDSNKIPHLKSSKIVEPTRGSHIAIRTDKLKLDHAVAMMSPDDGRWCYCMPFYDTIVVGTTELPCEETDTSVLSITRKEVIYLLNTMNAYFPASELTVSDVHCTWTGLRPLFPAKNAKKNSGIEWKNSPLNIFRKISTNGSETRENRILHDKQGMTTVVSTKLTSYRILAETVVKQILKKYFKNSGKGSGYFDFSIRLPLDRNLDFSWNNSHSELSDRRFKCYGSNVNWIEARIQKYPEERQVLVEGLDVIVAEISWAVMGEQALHLDDVLIRRLKIFYRDPDQGLGCCLKVAAHMAKILDKEAVWIENEIKKYHDFVNLSRAWRNSTLQKPSENTDFEAGY